MEKVRETASELNEVKTTREPPQPHSTQLIWRRVVRLFMSGLVVVALGAGLAGCEPLENGRTSISIDAKGNLQVGLCRDMRVREIRVSVTDKADTKLSSATWKGNSLMSEGEELSFDGRDEFVAVNLKKLGYSQDIVVFVGFSEQPGESGAWAAGVFSFKPSSLGEGEWVFPTGTRSNTVCGGYKSVR